MTAVNMLIALAVAPSDGASAARAGGEQRALFDGALAQAGRLLDAAAGESAAGAGKGDGGVHHSGVDATGDVTDGAADDEAIAGAVATAGSVMVAALGALLPSVQGQRETATVATGAVASGDDATVAPGSPAALAEARPDGAAGSPAPSATSSATASPSNAPATQTTPAAPAASDAPAAQTGAATAALRVDASAVSGGTSSTQSTMPPPSTAAATVEQAQGITTAASPTTTAAASAPSALDPQGGMSVRVRTAPASAPPAPTSATGANVDGGAGISSSSAVAPSSPPSSPVEVPAAATGSARQPIAAQVAPVLVSIVQRPVGTHRLTLTVNPESLGPVTVTAHIGRAGDVRVEIVGATEVGREALRAIVADLRRDLAAVMPHASLSVGSGPSSGADAAPDRGHGAPGGPAGENARGGSDADSRDRPSARQAPARPLDLASGIRPSARAGFGEGLDTFA